MQHVVFVYVRITGTDCRPEAVAWELEAMQHCKVGRFASLSPAAPPPPSPSHCRYPLSFVAVPFSFDAVPFLNFTSKNQRANQRAGPVNRQECRFIYPISDWLRAADVCFTDKRSSNFALASLIRRTLQKLDCTGKCIGNQRASSDPTFPEEELRYNRIQKFGTIDGRTGPA